MVSKIALLLLAARFAHAHSPTKHELRFFKRELNKPVVTPDFYDTKLDDGLLDVLPQTSYTLSQWTNNLIPGDCKDLIEGQTYQGEQLSAADAEVFNITYTDCDQPWVFCRHKESNATQDTIAGLWGRIPARMRSYVRHIATVPGDASAFSSNQNILIVGSAAGRITIYGHETGHSLDDHAYNGFDGSDFSKSSTWVNAFNKDEAVCQSYALASQQENLAQMTNVALYDQNAQGGIGNICSNWEEFQNQLEALEDNIGNTLKVGGSCQNRLTDSDPVPKGASSSSASASASQSEVVMTSLPGGTTTSTPSASTTGNGTVETFAVTPSNVVTTTTVAPTSSSTNAAATHVLESGLLAAAAVFLLV